MSAVRRMVLREVLWLVAVGASLGIPATLAASGLVRSLLFVISPTDLVTVAGATALLTVTAAVAPSPRSARIESPPG